MTVPRFITSVLIAACLVVAGAQLTLQHPGLAPAHESGPSSPILHTFLADQDPESAIECPVIGGAGIDEIFTRQPPLCWLGVGWSRAFEWGTWATGPVTSFQVSIAQIGPRTLMLDAKAPPNLQADVQQTVRLTVNDQPVDIRYVRRHRSTIRFDLPERVLRSGANTFTMEFAHATAGDPSARGKVRLKQAAAIHRMAVVSRTDTSEWPSERDSGTEIWDPDRDLLRVTSSGTLVLPIFIPAGTSALEFDLRTTTNLRSGKKTARFTIEGLDGEVAHTTEIKVPGGRSLIPIRLPVTRFAGRWVLVTLNKDVEILDLEVSRLHPVVSTFDSRSEPVVGVAAEETPPPDIVLITLDAARAASFGFAGYHRDTTPFIDEIAQSSLIFSNAFALAPYTLCSVPTMITGLSYLDHGVIHHEHVLDPAAVTLAEVLSGAGYLTAAFSATPNNSRAKGFDQGYEVFREMWTEGQKKVTRRAPFIAGQVVDWLDEIADDDRPLHLQIHMVPPHSPYDPPPAFDRFTDPAYDGPCNGWPAIIGALNSGSIAPERECIEHVHALYDGNLSVADNAVRTIVEALQHRPRWRDTVVLITSDHGEAFWEHRLMGHNASIHDEMLRVPFVLRMPDDFDSTGIDTDGLVSLADIVPTLVRAAGIAPPVLPDAVDLLDPCTTRDGRLITVRTASKEPELGVRTLRWSLMVNTAGSGALFDLASDPDEQLNVIAERPATYAGLGRILAARSGIPPLLSASQTDALSDEERELLKTLGYIR